MAALTLAVTTPAWAHVGFQEEQIPAGGAAQVSLRVPEEPEAAGEFTTMVKLFLPQGATLGTVTAAEVAGWTSAVAADSVTWTNSATQVGEEVHLFGVSFSSVPTTPGRLEFKAIQTYNTGREVRWIDPYPAGAEEPQFPSPVLDVVAGATEVTSAGAGDDDGDDHDAEMAESTSASASTTEATDSESADDATTGSDYGSIAESTEDDNDSDDSSDGFPWAPVLGAVLVVGGLIVGFGMRRKK